MGENGLLINLIKLWGVKDVSEIIDENIKYETDREIHIWNINNEYIFKMTYSEKEMKNNIVISKLLLKADISVPRVIMTVDKREYIKNDDRYYGLFTRIKGEVLKDYYKGDYINRGFYLGQCIANLHNGLKSITEELKKNKDIFDNNMIEELDGWVTDEINIYIPKCNLDKSKIETFNGIRDKLSVDFRELYYKIPRQAIHRDVHGENMIFKDYKLVGYIDFDLSQINVRIFDLCYLCTGALVKAFDNEELKDKWIDFSRAVINGYDYKNMLTDYEKKSIKYMMYAIELIMIAFFAKGGYEKIADMNIEIINWIEENWEYKLEG